MIRPLLVILSFCLFTGPLFAAPKPLDIDTLIAIPMVGTAEISPGGDWIAYTVSISSEEENANNTDIYLGKVDGSETLQLTNHDKSDFSPKFHPKDRNKLAFLSSRSGSSQIWMIDLRGGEPTQVTKLKSGVNQFEFAPDGKSLYFTATVFKGCDDDACHEKKQKEKDESKVDARVITEPLYRHWNHWLDGMISRLFRLDLKTDKINVISPQGLSVPPISLGGRHPFSATPDGSKVLFSSNADEDLSRSTNNDVFEARPNGRAVVNLTKDNKALDIDGTVSPNGRYLAYISHTQPGYESDLYRLTIFDKKTGKTTFVDQVDNWIREFVWSVDSKQIFFTTPDRGYSTIFAYDVDNKTLKRLTEKTYNYGLAVSNDAKTLVFTRSNFSLPPEIYAMNLLSGKTTRISNMTDSAMKNVTSVNVEEFEYTSFDGTQVHGFLIFPPNFKASRKYPLVLGIHGGPQGMWGNAWHPRWNAQLFANPGYVAAFINPRGSVGYGQKFTAQISKNWGDNCYRDLMIGVDTLIKRPYIDGNRMAAAGGSFGGYMVNWIAGQTDRFNALVSHAGVSDLRSKFGTTEEKFFPEWDIGGNPYDNPEVFEKYSPLNFAKNFVTPMLILHGHMDFRVSLEQALMLYSAYQYRKAPAKMVLYPSEAHWISKPKHVSLWWQSVHDWFKRHIDERAATKYRER